MGVLPANGIAAARAAGCKITATRRSQPLRVLRQKMVDIVRKGLCMARQGQVEEEAPELKELFATVGLRVRDLRTRKDMSQKDLSARSGIKVTYLNEIERIGVNLSLKLLYQLAKALEVQPSDLLPGRDIARDPEIKLGIVRKKLCDLVSSVQALEDRGSELILLIDREASPDEPT